MKEYYRDFTENIRHKILCEYGSIASFCEQNGMSKFTLSKAFNGRMMNVSTFVRICSALDSFDFVLPSGGNCPEMPLFDYLEVRFNGLEKAFIKVLLGE